MASNVNYHHQALGRENFFELMKLTCKNKTSNKECISSQVDIVFHLGKPLSIQLQEKESVSIKIFISFINIFLRLT